MRQAIVPLIQMCTDGLTFLANGNSLLNQIRMNYIASVLSSPMSGFAMKVPRDSELLFREKTCQQVLQEQQQQKPILKEKLSDEVPVSKEKILE